MSTVVEMRVHMDCAGCESKVKSALQKLKGVDTVDIDLTQQKVTVTGWADQKKVLKTVRRTGRRVELWQLPYTSEANDYALNNQHHFNGPVNYYASQPSSNYNYYKHGAGSSNGRYYQTGSSSAFGGHHTAGSAFSDENPHAVCRVM